MSSNGRSESRRREAVARWRRSGLSAAEFAPSLGVSVHTLYAWSHRCRAGGPRRGRGARVPTLVELVAGPSADGMAAPAGQGLGVTGGVVEIALRNGRVLRAPLGVDGQALGRLIGVAESA